VPSLAILLYAGWALGRRFFSTTSTRRFPGLLVAQNDRLPGQPFLVLNRQEPRNNLARTTRPFTEHAHGLLFSGTFVVRCFGRNSRSRFPPTRPARPTAALVKTRFAPRFAGG
jgi:hypothetical protein